MGLGCVKTPALAADVETFWRNCISESRIILRTTRFDALMENCFFYISRMYEFLHRLGQNRHCGDFRCMTALPPKAKVRPRSCYVARVPMADITPNLFDHRERPTRLVDVRSRYEAWASV